MPQRSNRWPGLSRIAFSISRGERRTVPGRKSTGICTGTATCPTTRTWSATTRRSSTAGTGIVYSCLKSATPMLVWPHDYDQFDHAARIVARRLGLRCDPSADRMEADLRRLLDDGEIRRSLERFRGILGEYDPHETFVEMLRMLDVEQESERL